MTRCDVTLPPPSLISSPLLSFPSFPFSILVYTYNTAHEYTQPLRTHLRNATYPEIFQPGRQRQGSREAKKRDIGVKSGTLARFLSFFTPQIDAPADTAAGQAGIERGERPTTHSLTHSSIHSLNLTRPVTKLAETPPRIAYA